jgi:hypothetical protein
MLEKEVVRAGGGRVVLMDTITKVAPEDTGSVVVSGSHGGSSSGEFALQVPLLMAVFNNAGVGKDDACIAWEHGVLSHLTARARELGLAPGERLRDAVMRLVQG